MSRGYIGVRFILAAILLLIYIVFFAHPGHSKERPPKPEQQQAIPRGYQDNPYQYLYGSVQDVTIFQLNGKYYTNFTVKPMNTYLFFSQSVTFCGDHRDKLNFKTNNTVIFIYSGSCITEIAMT